MSKKPGTSTGPDGGIFQEISPRGGKKDNWTTVPDQTKLPPTAKPGNEWQQVKQRLIAKDNNYSIIIDILKIRLYINRLF